MTWNHAGEWSGDVLYRTRGAAGSVNVTITNGDGTAATLYTDASKATTVSGNVVSTDSLGNLVFFADPGTYTCTAASGGSFTAVVGVSPADAGGGSGAVASVNGHTGTVVLAATDVGADASGAASAAQAAAQAFATSAVATETTRAEAAEGTLTTSVATNTSAIAAETSRAEAAEALKAPLASPTFTGTPAAPTATALTSNTQLATTAYADSAVGVEKTRALAAEALALPLTGGTMSGVIGMGSHKITALAKGTTSTDAATIGQSSMYSSSVARYSGASGQAPREAFPYWAATGNQACSAGVMYLALLPVCPGDVITNVGFVTGTSSAAFGSSGYHWWTALYDNTATFVAQSADQTNTAISSSHAYMLTLGSGAPYTVGAGVTYLYAAVMINTGTGGSPAQPTIRGPSQNVALIDSTTSLWPTAAIASATNGSSLGATAPTGTITPAASANLMYLGAS